MGDLLILRLVRPVPELGGQVGDLLLIDPTSPDEVVLRRPSHNVGLALDIWMRGDGEPVTPIPSYASQLARAASPTEPPLPPGGSVRHLRLA